MARLGKRTTTPAIKAKSRRNFSLVAMGGTFDVLHRGHRKLLKQAFSAGRNVVIGVTSDTFARRLHKPHKVDPYSLRKRELERLLSRWGVRSRTKVVELDDRFGPTVRNSRIRALVLSRRTLDAGREINARRRARGLRPLAIVPIDLVLAEDKRPISSTRIRRGRIDREGRLMK